MAKENKKAPTLEQLESELKKETYKNNYSRVLRSTFFSLIVVAAIAVIIAVMVLPVLQINGTSMTETLQDGDIVVSVNGSSYDTGDVIAFYFNNSILVKRVIAREGQWVDIDESGNVTVDGKRLSEPYLQEKAFGECNIELPYQVPDGRCFVMGDHRATSIDSRNKAVGCISEDVIIGKIILRIWPLNTISRIS
ncbi:MAG: signal peptidase I [Lachnospiraceae bacterium]|nr:signal peptidase I [Lachnospiraceae bacterium]